MSYILESIFEIIDNYLLANNKSIYIHNYFTIYKQIV